MSELATMAASTALVEACQITHEIHAFIHNPQVHVILFSMIENGDISSAELFAGRLGLCHLCMVTDGTALTCVTVVPA